MSAHHGLRATPQNSSTSAGCKGGPVTWEGKTRAPLLNQDVVPHAESGPFPAWIGVGGNPQSVIRAARLGFSAHQKPSRRRSPRTSAPWTPPGSI